MGESGNGGIHLKTVVQEYIVPLGRTGYVCQSPTLVTRPCSYKNTITPETATTTASAFHSANPMCHACGVRPSP